MKLVRKSSGDTIHNSSSGDTSSGDTIHNSSSIQYCVLRIPSIVSSEFQDSNRRP
jgi:hypothetical protein